VSDPPWLRRMSVLGSRCSKEAGEFDRLADHRQWPESMSTKSRCLAWRARALTGADPLLSLGRGEFGAHEHDRDVEPSLVCQVHHAPGHPSGTGIAADANAAPGFLVKVSRVRPSNGPRRGRA